MYRMIATTVCLAVCIGGCSQQHWGMGDEQMGGMPPKPMPSPQLLKLERLVGNWSGTAEMVSPTGEEMRDMMPAGDTGQTTVRGSEQYEWGLGGLFLVGEGWHDMGDGERAHYKTVWTWDAKNRKYRTWFFSDSGEFGEGWATWDADGSTLQVKATSHNLSTGAKSRGWGDMTFVDDNTLDWTWSEKNAHGKMLFKGTMRKPR